MHKLKPEDMIKTLFIFSDMEFDRCITMHDEPREPFDSYYTSQLFLASSKRNQQKQRKMTNYETVKVRSNIHMPPVKCYSGHVPMARHAALPMQECAAS